jgi:membrane protein required for colicin V production
MNIPVIDIVFAVLLFLLAFRAALRGFIEEFISKASLALGILGAVLFYKTGGVFIRERFMPGVRVIPELLAFILLFLIVFVVLKLLEYILKDIAARINLGGPDRLLGLIFGVFEGLVLISLILLLLKVQPLFNSAPLLEPSYFARFLLPLLRIVPAVETGHV